MITAGKYLQCLHQVCITLGEGQCAQALPPRRRCSSWSWLFHPHPSLLHETSSHPDPFPSISSPSTASGLASFTQLRGVPAPAPTFGLTHLPTSHSGSLFSNSCMGMLHTDCFAHLTNHPLAEALLVEVLEPLAHSQVSLYSPVNRQTINDKAAAVLHPHTEF